MQNWHNRIFYRIHSYEAKRDVLPLAMEALEKALELDRKLGAAHVMLAILRGYGGDYAGAEKEYVLAIQFDPNNADAHHYYSYLLAGSARYKDEIG